MQGHHPPASGSNPHPHRRRTPCRTLQRARKALDAVDQEADQGRGKDVERKSPKADFPFQLANPAKHAGFALYHRLYDDEMSFPKPDTSFVLKSGHFYLLTTLTNRWDEKVDPDQC